jgi:hypothetical protein
MICAVTLSCASGWIVGGTCSTRVSTECAQRSPAKTHSCKCSGWPQRRGTKQSWSHGLLGLKHRPDHGLAVQTKTGRWLSSQARDRRGAAGRNPR